MNDSNARWHQKTLDAVCAQLHTDAAVGLDRRAARSRFKKEGANTLFDTPKTGVSWLLRPLFCDPSVLLMLFCAILALCFGEIFEGSAFLLVLLAAVGISLRLILKWRKNEERIARYRIPTARVVRDGTLYSVSARRIVRGDLLLLRRGDIVPCDCRLLSENELRVLTLSANEAGKPTYLPLPKNAQKLYTYGDKTPLLQCENMLTAGSQILSGEARAIAVAVGEATCVGAMKLFSIPAESQSKKDASELSTALSPYLRLWGILTLAVMLLVSAFALLIPTGRGSLISAFFSLTVWLGCASPAVVALLTYMLSLRTHTECMEDVGENRAVLKSARAADMLSGVTDLLVIGHVGSSDGVPHLSRAVVGRGEIPLDGEPSAYLDSLCEAFFLLKMASEGLSVAMREAGEDDTALLSELLSASEFDLPALRVRLLHARAVRRTDRSCEVSVETKESVFSLIFSHDVRITDACAVYEDGERYCTIPPAFRNALVRFESEVSAEGGKTVTVLRRLRDGTNVFVGVVGVWEEKQIILPSVVEELSQCGVTTHFFLNAEDSLYADACRLSEMHVSYADAPELTLESLEDHRVFLGYSTSQIADLLAKMRKNGRRVAILTNHAAPALLRTSPLLISPDPTPYHRRASEEAALEQLPDEGRENSARCSQSTRRRADMLICRAGRCAGGVAAVLQTLSQVRVLRVRACLLLGFIGVTQCARMVWCILSTVLGIGLSDGAAMLYTGLWMPLVALFGILYLPVPQVLLRHHVRFDVPTLIHSLFPRKIVLSALISIAVTTLYAVILKWCGVIGSDAASSYTFVSIVVLQALIYVSVIRTTRIGILSLAQGWLTLLCMLLPAVALLPILHFLPASTFAFTAVTLCSLPLCAIVYFFTGLSLSVFSHAAK